MRKSFAVLVLIAFGCSDPSPHRSSTGPTTLPAPSNLSVNVDCRQFLVTWDVVAGADGYAVFRKFDGPEERWVQVRLVPPETTSYTEARPANSPKRWFRVKTIQLQGDPSNEEEGDARQTPAAVDGRTLALRREPAGNNDKLIAHWDEPPGPPAKYELEIQHENQGHWEFDKSATTTRPTYEFLGSPQQRYRYKVRSLNECDDVSEWSDWSNPA